MSIRTILNESKQNFDNLYTPKDGDDITEYVLKYLNWSSYGEYDATFSILASKLHDGLMYTLCLNHENTEDRHTFAKILDYLKILKKRVGIRKVKIYKYTYWENFFEKCFDDKDSLMIDANDFSGDSLSYIYDKAVMFESYDGIENVKYDYRPGSCNGSSGHFATHAKMTDEMKNYIYSLGLVPALYVSGSYHENFITCVGILPEMLSVTKKSDGFNFDCKF